jgi:hypothetical protein
LLNNFDLKDPDNKFYEGFRQFLSKYYVVEAVLLYLIRLLQEYFDYRKKNELKNITKSLCLSDV